MPLIAIGASIRRARVQQGLTQARVAAELRMSRATLSRLESGSIGELGIRKVIRVCDRLGLVLRVSTREESPLDGDTGASAAAVSLSRRSGPRPAASPIPTASRARVEPMAVDRPILVVGPTHD